ncbi:Rhodanese-like protein [Basidiobolus meristosporus CBS 931.73]|uniref:Rhodanese-like protein n=1 Tax=Basidiobolus meristosporus CBS 931.73 TaxID=1314790 RepID=A0A1Y1YKC6_9FUNG|nr:Rhodanese-like protein [Basidiobolus meristosporus CBS 931.73]|eukprot:ORX98477.1 Rhodanese-like protein [Basidiobolus meristosporus CBS 931.73]
MNLVSTQWLADNKDSVVVLDGSWHMPHAKRDPKQEYLNAHIQNARYFDIDAIKDLSNSLPHMLPSPEFFARSVGELGISQEDKLVVYDTAGIFSSPRVYWTFKAFGHDNIAILDGGLPKWLQEGRPVEAGQVDVEPKVYKPKFQPQLVRNMQQVVQNIEKGADGELVIDARPRGRFNGVDPEPRAGLSSGHIPNSVSLPFSEVIDPEKRVMRSPQELARLFKDLGIDVNQKIITSCGSGVSAAVIYLALEIAGAKNLALYDGSWTEYASHPENKISKL